MLPVEVVDCMECLNSSLWVVEVCLPSELTSLNVVWRESDDGDCFRSSVRAVVRSTVVGYCDSIRSGCCWRREGVIGKWTLSYVGCGVGGGLYSGF